MTTPQDTSPEAAPAVSSAENGAVDAAAVKKPKRKIPFVTIIVFVSLYVVINVLLAGLGGPFFTVEMPFYLLFGWLIYLVKLWPHVSFNPLSLLPMVLYLVVITLGAHYFLRWISVHVRKTASAGASRPTWRWRWTLAGVTIFLMTFVTGIAATGGVHQLLWLVSGEPLLELGGRKSINRSLIRNHEHPIIIHYSNEGSLPIARSWVPLKELEFHPPLDASTDDLFRRPVMYLSDGKSFFLRSYGSDGVPDSENGVSDDVFLYVSGAEMDGWIKKPPGKE